MRARSAGIHRQGSRAGKDWNLTTQYVKGIRLFRNLKEPRTSGSEVLRSSNRADARAATLTGFRPLTALVFGALVSLRGLPFE